MNVEQLREMLRGQPFHPFELYLADGRSIPVDHPEMVAIAPAPGRTIGVGRSDGTIEIVDLLLVTSLKPQPNGNGSSGSNLN